MEFQTKRHFLSLGEKCSQIYLNKYSIFLILLAIKIHLFRQTLVSTLNTISNYPSPCLDSKTVTDSLHAVTSMINRVITDHLAQVQYSYAMIIACFAKTVKALIIFYIDLFLGTYTCLLNAAIAGAANFAVNASEDIIVFVNGTMVHVATDVQDGLDGLSKILNSLIKAYSKVKSFFDGSAQPDPLQYLNKIDLSIASLKNFSIPGSVLSNINNFRDHELPAFTNIQNATQSLISLPFDKFAETMKLLKSPRNMTLLHPLSQDLLYADIDPLCSGQSQGLSTKFAHLVKSIDSAALTLLIIIAICAILALVPEAWKSYRDLQRQAQYTTDLIQSSIIRECVHSDNSIATGNVIDRYQSPILYSLYRFTSIRSPYVYWVVNYVTSPQATVVFLLGFLGIVAALLQFGLLAIVSKGSTELHDLLHNPSNTAAISKAAAQYVNETNRYILGQEQQLNDELFGNIHNISTSLNTTIVDFMNILNTTLTDAFGKTPFAGPINLVVYCTIGRKLIGIEHGLTWLNDNLKIQLPPLNGDIGDDITRIAQSKQGSILGSSIEKAFTKAINTSKHAIWIELYVALAIFGVWILQLLIALCVVSIRRYRDKTVDDWEEEKLSVISIANKLHPEDVSSPHVLTDEERLAHGYPVHHPFAILRPNPTSLPPRTSSIYSGASIERFLTKKE